MLSSLIFLFLATPHAVVALLRCFHTPAYLQDLAPPKPLADDCLAIAAHIPVLNNLANVEQHRYSPTFPFFPRAHFVGRRCTVRISYSSEPPPPANVHDTGATFNAIAGGQQRTPPTPLSVASVAEIWRAAKSAIIDVTDRCIRSNRAGFEWAFVDVPEIKDAWYLVEVIGTDTSNTDLLTRTVQLERNMLMGIYPDNLFSRTIMGENRFKISIWEVP